MSSRPVSCAEAGSPGQDHPVPDEGIDDAVGRDAIAIPTEDVLLARVSLPAGTARQVQAGLGSAVESLLAEPLDGLHVVPGQELGQGDRLVAILRHSVMADWALRTDARRPRLVPDVLALPVPPAGSLFARESRGRVLVRLADGTGFATTAESFPAFWRAAGMPGIVLFSGRLQPDLPISGVQPMPPVPPPEALTFDLMTDRHARKAGLWPRKLAAVAVLGLAGHLAILGAETIALGRIAERLEARLRGDQGDAPAVAMPTQPDAGPLRQASPMAGQSAGGGFLPLLARASGALPVFGEGVGVRSMTFDAGTGELDLLVEGPDLASLQAMETRLAAAGLSVSAGAATSSSDAAEMRLVIGRIADER